MTNLSALIAAGTPAPQQVFRLEGIFLPEVRRLREQFFANDLNPRFVHYTRAEAALEIIKKKRLWLRNATAMVDFTPGVFKAIAESSSSTSWLRCTEAASGRSTLTST